MDRALEAAVLTALGTPLPKRMGVAVSGGGDSVALLHVLKKISENTGLSLFAVTVDHGLRPGSQAEAEGVAALCAGLGVAHDTLTWHWEGTGNLQDAAREARFALIGDWAVSRGLDMVALGHTADDQAETVLMRLARRAGVDGLAAMATRSHRDGVVWLRPLLGVRRDALRAVLQDADVPWIEDPSNTDTRFTRVKVRGAMAALAQIGIDAQALGVVAENMAQARDALIHQTDLAAQAAVNVHHGALAVDVGVLHAQPAEIQRRLWVRAVTWITGARYAPRRDAVAHLMQAVTEGRTITLGGCVLQRRGENTWIFREYDPVAPLSCAPQDAWDGRWRCIDLSGAGVPPGADLRALGPTGLKQCDNWRALGLPRGALLSHPALWHGDTVLASPVAKPRPDRAWRLTRNEKAFFRAPL